MRTGSGDRKRMRALARQIAAEDRKTLKGCVVVAEQDALTAADRKRLEKLGAVVIEKKMTRSLHFTWPPEGRL